MSPIVTFVASLMLVTLASSPSHAYSAGAPIGVCDSMMPAHHTDPQSSASPYRLTVSTNQARNGEAVTITIDGATPANTIKGYLVQARQNGKVVGWFDATGEPKYAQTIDCDGKPQSAITHRKIEGTGPKKLSFKWTAPQDLKGVVTFRATVAHNGGVFWVGQESTPLNVV